MLLTYQPYRIIQKFVITVSNHNELATKYPHAISTRHPIVAAGEYIPGKVIDIPTDCEILFFDSLSDMLVAKIPQKAGFDDPMSKLARSRKQSRQGKMKFLRVAEIKPTVTKATAVVKEKPVTTNIKPIHDEPYDITTVESPYNKKKFKPVRRTDIKDNPTNLLNNTVEGENNE